MIDRVKKWWKEDMIDRHIWTNIQSLVDYDLPDLPTVHPSESMNDNRKISHESSWHLLSQINNVRICPFKMIANSAFLLKINHLSVHLFTLDFEFSKTHVLCVEK